MISFTVAEFIILSTMVFVLLLGSFLVGLVFTKNGRFCNDGKHFEMPNTIKVEKVNWNENDKGDK